MLSNPSAPLLSARSALRSYQSSRNRIFLSLAYVNARAAQRIGDDACREIQQLAKSGIDVSHIKKEYLTVFYARRDKVSILFNDLLLLISNPGSTQQRTATLRAAQTLLLLPKKNRVPLDPQLDRIARRIRNACLSTKNGPRSHQPDSTFTTHLSQLLSHLRTYVSRDGWNACSTSA